MLAKGEEEAPYLPTLKTVDDMIEECTKARDCESSKRKAVDYAAETINKFTSQSMELQAIVKSFPFKFGNKEGEQIEKHILSEAKQIVECPMEKPGEIPRVWQQSCYICRQCMPKAMNTQWKCDHCDTPLCQVDRTELGKGRGYSCIEEHQNSDNEFLGCGLMTREPFIMPEHLKKYTMTQALIAKKTDANEKKR